MTASIVFCFARYGKRDREDRPDASPSKEGACDRESPPRINHVIDQQHRACQQLALVDLKCSVKVVRLLKTILHFFLRRCCQIFSQAGAKWQMQHFREPLCKTAY